MIDGIKGVFEFMTENGLFAIVTVFALIFYALVRRIWAAGLFAFVVMFILFPFSITDGQHWFDYVPPSFTALVALCTALLTVVLLFIGRLLVKVFGKRES